MKLTRVLGWLRRLFASRRSGQHYILDAQVSRVLLLSDRAVIEELLVSLVAVLGVNLRHSHVEEFSNGTAFGPGITALGLLSESHIAIHTAPERQALWVDIYSCKRFSKRAVRQLLGKTFRLQKVVREMVLDRTV